MLLLAVLLLASAFLLLLLRLSPLRLWLLGFAVGHASPLGLQRLMASGTPDQPAGRPIVPPIALAREAR